MKRKNLIFCLSVALVILLLSVWMISDLRHWPSRKLIETNLDPQCPMVALTFDDGPQRPYTEQVLNILYDQQVPATFFWVNTSVTTNRSSKTWPPAVMNLQTTVFASGFHHTDRKRTFV